MKAATYAGLPGLAEPDTPGANPLSLCRTRARRRTVRSGHPPHNGQLARAVFPSMAPLSGIESTRRCHRGETRLAADPRRHARPSPQGLEPGNTVALRPELAGVPGQE